MESFLQFPVFFGAWLCNCQATSWNKSLTIPNVTILLKPTLNSPAERKLGSSATVSIDATTRFGTRALPHLSCKHHISCTIFHILLTHHQIIHFFHISFDFCSPSAPAFPKTRYNVWNNITMQRWYHSFIFPYLLCTVSLLNSALAWWDQKTWFCRCERKLHFKTIARANYFPRFSLGSFWLLWSPFQEAKHILQADDSGSFASYSEGFANYGKVISFSAISFLEITNPLIFCLRQYMQLASKEFIWMRHIISFHLGNGITTVTKNDLQNHFLSPQDFAESQTQNKSFLNYILWKTRSR